jgi:hypothetical protein
VRSDNGGPFNYCTVETAPPGTVFECGQPAPATLGCGSIIHGITFDFDSAVIRPESGDVLAELYKGLVADSGRVVIEGHSPAKAPTTTISGCPSGERRPSSPISSSGGWLPPACPPPALARAGRSPRTTTRAADRSTAASK